MPEFDAVLVPGGGVRGAGELPQWTQRRLERAIQIHAGKPIITLSAGTVHRPPPLDSGGFPIFESLAAARFLLSRGVPAGDILSETCSYDTVGNAYFVRVIHVDPRGMRRLLVVTSQFHMPRTRSIFEWVFGFNPPAGGYRLDFETVSDEGIPDTILGPRLHKEKAGLAALKETQRGISTWEQFLDWFFTQHDCYAVDRQPQRQKGAVLDSY